MTQVKSYTELANKVANLQRTLKDRCVSDGEPGRDGIKGENGKQGAKGETGTYYKAFFDSLLSIKKNLESKIPRENQVRIT